MGNGQMASEQHVGPTGFGLVVGGRTFRSETLDPNLKRA